MSAIISRHNSEVTYSVEDFILYGKNSLHMLIPLMLYGIYYYITIPSLVCELPEAKNYTLNITPSSAPSRV